MLSTMAFMKRVRNFEKILTEWAVSVVYCAVVREKYNHAK